MLGREDEERRRTASTDETIAQSGEEQRLLPNGSEPVLYRTISRRSEVEHLPADNDDLELSKTDTTSKTSAGVYATLSILLLGVFVSQTDQSLVLATYGTISSEFHDLESGSWLLSAYILAQCVAQPLYGKLSDIYGRKSALQTSYLLFAIGTLGSGLGPSMGAVIASRAIQGAGGAGMISMVSIIITDLVPIHEVATLRSYVNILATTGRSAGGVIGGALTQTLGWRWAFLVQVPPIIIAIILVQWRLKLAARTDHETTHWEKLKRVDFLGAILLCATIFSLCFVVDTGGRQFAWNSPLLVAICVSGGVTAIAYGFWANYTPDPIFPLRLLTHYEHATNYAVLFLQCISQFSLTMSVPPYFQSTRKVSTALAGAYLIPAFAGNTAGGLLAGYWIKRTGRYKWPTVFAPILATSCMVLCLTTWNGDTGAVGSLAVFPGGFATGMLSSSAFVGLAAAASEEDMASAASGMYLFYNFGGIAAVSAGTAASQTGLRVDLWSALKGVKDRRMVLQGLMEDLNYLRHLPDDIWQRTIPAYVRSFHRVNYLGLGCTLLSLVIAIFSRQRRLQTSKK